MNTHNRPVLWRTAALTAGAALTLGTALFAWPLISQAADKPSIVISDSPVNRDGRIATSYSSIVKKVGPSVVNIYTTKKVSNPHRGIPSPFWPFGGEMDEDQPRRNAPKFRREQSLGSGVIVSREGYILTNDHVVDGADEIKVVLNRDKKEFSAKVVGKDPNTDVAVLKIDGKDLPYATLADSDKLEVGDVVLAIGNPFGLGQTVTSGIISALSRGDIGIETYEDFIQTDAAVNPGNSGGALVDTEGRLIGINTAILSRTGGNQGVSFAIPINLAHHVMSMLIKDGRVTRGFLGIMPQDLTPELAAEFKVPEANGALVTEVTENSAADEAGIRVGDVITELNGKQVKDARNFRLMVSKAMPGSKVELKLVRDGKDKTLKATLRERKDDEIASGGKPEKDAEGKALEGVEVSDINNQTRTRFGLPPGLKGAVISNIDPDSASYQAGLRVGNVIQEINRKQVSSADEAVELSAKVKGDRVVVRVWSRGASRYITIDESKSK